MDPEGWGGRMRAEVELMDKSGERRAACGFSLVELLVVIAVLGVLLAMVAGISNDFVSSTRLDGDGGELVARLGTAQQKAVTVNRPVQVRIYHWEEGGEARWGGLQIWERGDGAVGFRPRENFQRFSEGVVVVADVKYSSLLGLGEHEAGGGEGPGVVGARYVAFDFLPGGSTNLPVGGDPPRMHWHLTLVRSRELARSDGGLPRDFVTVQVDPLTGAVRRLRP
jgi:uncharacterized protein (TIGR02596 family)